MTTAEILFLVSNINTEPHDQILPSDSLMFFHVFIKDDKTRSITSMYF